MEGEHKAADVANKCHQQDLIKLLAKFTDWLAKAKDDCPMVIMPELQIAQYCAHLANQYRRADVVVVRFEPKEE